MGKWLSYHACKLTCQVMKELVPIPANDVHDFDINSTGPQLAHLSRAPIAKALELFLVVSIDPEPLHAAPTNTLGPTATELLPA